MIQGKFFETIDLNKCLFQVLGFLTVDVSSPYFTLVEEVQDQSAQGVIFGFMADADRDLEHIPADFTVIDVTADDDEPDVTKMSDDDVDEFDVFVRRGIELELENDSHEIIRWIGTEKHIIAQEVVMMTGYVVRIEGCDRQYVIVRRRMACRNICIIGTFDVRRTDDFMKLIMEMLGRVRAMTYHS